MKKLLSLLAVFAIIATGSSQTATTRTRVTTKSPGVVLNKATTNDRTVTVARPRTTTVAPGQRTMVSRRTILTPKATTRPRPVTVRTNTVRRYPSRTVRTAPPVVVVAPDDSPKPHHKNKKWKHKKRRQHHDNRDKSKHHGESGHDNRNKSKHN
ncbi:MAG TPA: lipoprotein [Flavobacterium sp.]|jgi:Ni/Co efflux regulator RcnB